MEWDVYANFDPFRVHVNHLASRVIILDLGAEEQLRRVNVSLRVKMVGRSPILLVLCETRESRSTDFLRCAKDIGIIRKGFFSVNDDVSDLNLTLAALLIDEIDDALSLQTVVPLVHIQLF